MIYKGIVKNLASINTMNIQIDPEHVRTSMSLWRESVDMKIPMRDEFKVHFMARRRDILHNFAATAKSWLMMLYEAKAGDGEQADFEALVEEIKAFGAWASHEIEEIEKLG